LRRLAVGIYQYSNMATPLPLPQAEAAHHDSWAMRPNEREREQSTHPFAKLVPKQRQEAQAMMMEIIFKSYFMGIGASLQLLTLSQRVRTCVSVNWLHSFSCSIHWSRSFVVALSSIAVVEEKVSSIFVDSILTAFFNDGGTKKYLQWVASYVLHLFLEILLKMLEQSFVAFNNFLVFFVHTSDDDTK